MKNSDDTKSELQIVLQQYKKQRNKNGLNNSYKSKGTLIYCSDTHMKQCHIDILSNTEKLGFDLKYNWENFGMKGFIKDILCWDIKTHLFIDLNSSANLLNQIQNVAFPHLKQLSLSYCSIESFEILQNIYMPMLSTLNIKNNNAKYIKSIRKINCPQLTKLVLNPTQILDLQFLSQLKINAKGQIQSNGLLQNQTAMVLPRILFYSANSKCQSKYIKKADIEPQVRVEYQYYQNPRYF